MWPDHGLLHGCSRQGMHSAEVANGRSGRLSREGTESPPRSLQGMRQVIGRRGPLTAAICVEQQQVRRGPGRPYLRIPPIPHQAGGRRTPVLKGWTAAGLSGTWTAHSLCHKALGGWYDMRRPTVACAGKSVNRAPRRRRREAVDRGEGAVGHPRQDGHGRHVSQHLSVPANERRTTGASGGYADP